MIILSGVESFMKGMIMTDGMKIDTHVEMIYDAIISKNPFLKNDVRVNLEMIVNLVDYAVKALKESDNIDYDNFLIKCADFLALPEEIVKPFTCTLLPILMSLDSSKKLFSYCNYCNTKHDILNNCASCKQTLFFKSEDGQTMLITPPSNKKSNLN